VVPWTKSACNVDAKLMIIAQDWASEKYFQRPKNRTSWRDTLRTHLGQDPQLPTNRNIRRLLRCFGIKWRQTYATDVSIFIEPGNMNGDVPDALLRYCAIKYTIPQLRIVRPKMVLCLGSRTFNAVRYALGMPAMKLNAACGLEPHTVDDQTGTAMRSAYGWAWLRNLWRDVQHFADLAGSCKSTAWMLKNASSKPTPNFRLGELPRSSPKAGQGTGSLSRSGRAR
jgi:hypothetical protein